MQTRPCLLGPLILSLTLTIQSPTCFAQGTAFTYQGHLNVEGWPANGSYDLELRIFNLPTGGSPIAPCLTNAPTLVSNGLCNVVLNFGEGVFIGGRRWLEMGVRTNGSTNGFTTLSPRQEITSAPYSLYAVTAGSANSFTGVVSATQLSGTISSANIASGTISSEMLAPGAVTTEALADGAITAQKLTNISSWFLTARIASPSPTASNYFAFAVAPFGTDRVLIGRPKATFGSAHLFSQAGALLMTITTATELDFGRSVATVGDLFLVGAPRTGFQITPEAGSAQLFNTNGNLVRTFTNPDPDTGDQFGSALVGVGTDRVLIGANGDESGGPLSGVAYLFHTNGTLLRTFLNPNPAAGDRFGSSVAALGADRVLIGASNDVSGAIRGGAAYLFSTGGALSATFINPTPATNDFFGSTVVAIGNDRVLVGAPLDDTMATDAGAAYLFDTNGVLLGTFVNPAGQSGDQFGSTLASISGNRVVIGGPRDSTGAARTGVAYVFGFDGTLLNILTNPVPQAFDLFGNGLAVLGNGKLLIAAPGVDEIGVTDSGAAYVFSEDSFVPGLVAERVAGNVALRAGGNSFTGSQTVMNGLVGIGTEQPLATLHVVSTRNTTLDNTATFFNSSIGGRASHIHWGTLGDWYIRSASTAGKVILQDGGGNVGIGTISPTSTLEVNGSAAKPGGGSWSVASDERLKRNVRPLSGVLDKLLGLHGVSFEYIAPEKIHELSGERMGLIAQEVEKVFPDWVETGADGYKRVTVRGLEALVVEALRELRTEKDLRIGELEKRLERLEQRVGTGTPAK